MNIHSAIIIVLFSACISAFALGPHEIIIIANDKSPDSIEIAEKHAALRKVPALNVIRISLPEYRSQMKEGISRDDFTGLIWKPVTMEIKKRGIGDHLLAWIYSCDLPTMVNTVPPVSITGITFCRNILPKMDLVEKGAYASPLFSGPREPGGRIHCSQSFDNLREWLREDYPLPSMILGYTGEGGNTVAEVLAAMERGKASDATRPGGKVFMVISDDVRSKCRAWQYPVIKTELEQYGIGCVITSNFPAGQKDIIGLMTGSANVDPGRDNVYMPGAIAEHLTSSAGVFSGGGQTPMSVWVSAGAAMTAGTVTEPMSLWTKFPSAVVFRHYAEGCTAIESLYQSVRCPFQLLPMGDPLAQPWGMTGKISIEGITEKPIAGRTRYRAVVGGEYAGKLSRYLWLIDGKETGGSEPVLELDPEKVEDGQHEIRVVGYRGGLPGGQIFATGTIAVRGKQ